MANQRVRPEELRKVPGFNTLPARRLDLLSRNIKTFTVRKKALIYRTGEPAKNIYVVLDGQVGLSLSGSNGHFVRLSVLGAGEFFGICALIPVWHRVSYATALRDSWIGEVSARSFVHNVCGIPLDGFSALTELTLKPLLLVSLRRALFLVEQLPNRIALALWEYANHPEAKKRLGVLPSSLTQEELSAVVGASRPRVSRALKQFEERGLFNHKGRSIRVQTEKLRAHLRQEFEFLL